MSTTTPNEYVDFWQERYDSQTTPWDLGGPSPHFEGLIGAHPDVFARPGRGASVGCGRGHDTAFFARNSALTMTGLDYAPGAVAEATRLYGHIAEFRQADCLNPPAELAGQFDVVIEHTFYCAINPRRRDDYVRAVCSLLKPGGHLAGVFWAFTFDGDGPPFPTAPEALGEAFSEQFEILSVVPVVRNAAHPDGSLRPGQEYRVLMQRRPG